MARNDLAGQRFGSLVVSGAAGSRTANGGLIWDCVCDCGSLVQYRGDLLKSGRRKSCGQHNDGRSDTSEYSIWLTMRARCTNPKNHKFADYGGRGIRVCDRWLSFDNFLADMGPRPSPQHSLERKENSGNYEPSNVRWATAKEQANNTRGNRLITINGETRPMTAWLQHYKISKRAFYLRLSKGWNEADALSKAKKC